MHFLLGKIYRLAARDDSLDSRNVMALVTLDALATWRLSGTPSATPLSRVCRVRLLLNAPTYRVHSGA